MTLGFDINGQVIDYISHPRLNEYLAERHSVQPFDAIIDIAGANDSLYFDSPHYLKSGGIYLAAGKIGLTYGGGGIFNILSLLVSFLVRTYLPLFLGGVPRKLMFHSGNVTRDSMEPLPGLVENGNLRSLVDSEWPFEEAVKVSAPS
jgi:NADPH:quinone reductase-like Zn-dependent oxidoreductase